MVLRREITAQIEHAAAAFRSLHVPSPQAEPVSKDS
jgi:hypothetical protein